VTRSGHPRFCPRYPIGTCLAGNGGVRSSRDNVSSLRQSGRESASRHGDCQHHGGRGLGWGGMANPGEASVNVVTQDKPKVLLQNGDSCVRPAAAAKSGLGQKACGQVLGLRTPPAQTMHHRRRDAASTTRSFRLRNVVSPLLSHGVGTPQGLPMGLRVKEEGGSEGRLVIGRIGIATLSHPQGGRLPSGVDARDRTANRLEAAPQICHRSHKGSGWCGCPHGGISGAGSVRVTCRAPQGQ
jgi:hypothetical protein